jgi:hypothetical protein
VLKADADREYEALAREFAQLTARCLASEESLVKHRGMLKTLIERQARERNALYSDVPGLTPGEAERLAILSERCGEVAKVVGKICRFGWESSSPFGGPVNRVLLEREVGALRAVVTLMVDAGDLGMTELQGWQRAKKGTLAKWTLYQDCSMPRGEQLSMMKSIADEHVGLER